MMKGKKYIKTFLVLALVLALVAEAFILPAKQASAAEKDQKVSITKSKLKKAKVNITIYINGEKQSKKGFKVTGKLNGKKHTFVYVPCEAIAGAINTDFVKKKKKITIVTGDNWQISFTAGKDAYTYSTIEGKKETYGPLSLGKSYTKKNIIYVPIEVFSVLAEKVNVKTGYSLKGKKLVVTLEQGEKIELGDDWQNAESAAVTTDIASSVDKAQETFAGGTITPVAQIVTQKTDNGEAYGLLGRIKATVPDAAEKYVFFVVFVGADGKTEIMEIRDTEFPTNINGLPGGWYQPESIELTAEEKAAFDKLMSERDGVEYKPIAKVAEQVEAGKNVCVLCESRVVVPNAPTTYSFVYIYMGLDGKVEITDIKTYNPDEDDQEGQSGEENPAAEMLDTSKAAADDFDRRTDGQFEAYTELGLAATLEECMKFNDNWDDPNFVEIKTEVKNDITISHEIGSMASVVLTNGATITIEKGGLLQAAVDVLQGCTVIVKDGGKFWTTQGGNIENDSTIIVEKGGELRSMFGGRVINHGSIELNGTFACGSVRFEGQTGIWFENQGGKVTGKGDALVYGAYVDKDDPIDLNDCADKLKTELGPDSKIKISVDPEGPSFAGNEGDEGDNGNAGGSVNVYLDFNGGEIGMEENGVYKVFSTSEIHNPEVGGKYTVGVMGPFHKDGYKLVGWSEKPDGSGKIYKNMEDQVDVTGDMYFYAVWEKE
jgi:hypothetical protein